MSTENHEVFPCFTFDGQTSKEIGHQHGTLLADRIDQAIKIYHQRFIEQPKYNENYFLNLCDDYHRGIRAFSSDYIDEINSIAIASKQDPRWIVALNSRLEILNHLGPAILNECTVIYDRTGFRLGENWDWIQAFETLAFVNSIPKKGILQMTEPGALGKIGFNSSGIGVTINFVDPVFQSKEHRYVPLHILLRTILEQARTFDDALDIFRKNGPCFGGHTLIADGQGNHCCVELPGDQVRFLENHSYHTNHFLSVKNHLERYDSPRYQSSIDRYERVEQLLNENQTLETIFSDKNEGSQKYPICRPYKKSRLGMVGTVCSIIMDLKNKTFQITGGNPTTNSDYRLYRLNEC